MTTIGIMQPRNARRSGASAVEFALCAPLLFLLVFAAWEFSRANMILNTMENAAYEGCRRGIVPGASANDVRASAQAATNTSTLIPAAAQIVARRPTLGSSTNAASRVPG